MLSRLVWAIYWGILQQRLAEQVEDSASPKGYRFAYRIGWSAIALPFAYLSVSDAFTKHIQLTYLYPLPGQLVLVTPDKDLKTGGSRELSVLGILVYITT